MTEKVPQIGVFTLAYSPFEGGAEIALREIIKRLPNYRFSVFTHKFHSRWSDFEEVDENLSIFRLGRGKSGDFYGQGLTKFFYIFRAWRKAEKIHRQTPFSAIWAVMAAYGGLTALLFKLRHPKVPLLLTLQEGDSEEFILDRVGLFYPFWRLIFRKADYIQTISNYLADFARRHGARCPIEVVPNGVDTTKYEKVLSLDSSSSSRRGGRKYEKNKQEAIIITTSRLVYKNGVDILIQAVAELKKIQPPTSDFQLLIVGGGPEEQKLKQLVKDLRVEDRIEFLGQVPADKIPAYLSQADIFVRPSRSEGLGSSFLEAMVAGLPVIGTAVGGISDFLRDGTTGLFAMADDSKDLADKISSLMENDGLRKKLGENGRKLVLENYSWDSVAQRMGKVFKSLVISHKPLVRILIATGLYPPEVGGPATYTHLVETELVRRGFLVSVLPFRAVKIWPKGLRHLVYFFKALYLAFRSDLVYAQDPVSVGLPAMLAAKTAGKPFLIRIAGDYAWEQAAQRFGVKDPIDDFQSKKYGPKTELLRFIQRGVANQARLIITPSHYFKKLVGGWVRKPEKVKAVYNGVDLNIGGYGGYIQWKPQPDVKRIVSAGRLVPWKGFDKLIEFMVDLPDWHLVIIGDGPEREKLKVKSEKLRVNDRIKLVGAVPRGELLEYLKNAAIFVLNTSFESFSFQVVEAMNAGMPVIATRIGNLSEIIVNNRDGVLIEPDNKEEFLKAVNKITSDQKFREKLSINAQARAKEFSIEKTTNQLVDLFSENIL